MYVGQREGVCFRFCLSTSQKHATGDFSIGFVLIEGFRLSGEGTKLTTETSFDANPVFRISFLTSKQSCLKQ